MKKPQIPQMPQISQMPAEQNHAMKDADHRDPKTYAIIGAAMEVHRQLGPGLLEAVYQESLEIELGLRGIPFQAQPSLQCCYKGRELKKHYVPDFICHDGLIVEIKAEKTLLDEHRAQIINQLKIARRRVGLLINFGEPSLRFGRFVNGYEHGARSQESAPFARPEQSILSAPSAKSVVLNEREA